MVAAATIILDGEDVSDDVLSWRVTYGSDAPFVATHPITLTTARGVLRLNNVGAKYRDRQGGRIRIAAGDQTLWSGIASRTDPAVLGTSEVADFSLSGRQSVYLNQPAKLSLSRTNSSPWDILSLIMGEAGPGTLWGNFVRNVSSAQMGQIEVLGWQPSDGPWTRMLTLFAHLCGGWAVESRGGAVRISPWTYEAIDNATDLRKFQPLRGSILVARPAMSVTSCTHHAIEKSRISSSQNADRSVYLPAGGSVTLTVERPDRTRFVSDWDVSTSTVNASVNVIDSDFFECTFSVTGTPQTFVTVSVEVTSHDYPIEDTLSFEHENIGELAFPVEWSPPPWIRAPFSTGSLADTTAPALPSSLPVELAESLSTTPGWLRATWSLHDESSLSTLANLQPGDTVLARVDDREATILILAVTLQGSAIYASSTPQASRLNMELIGIGTEPVTWESIPPHYAPDPPKGDDICPVPAAPTVTQDQATQAATMLQPTGGDLNRWQARWWFPIGQGTFVRSITYVNSAWQAAGTQTLPNFETGDGRYQAQVRIDCGGEYSDWSSPTSFSILPAGRRAYWDPVRLRVVVPNPFPATFDWIIRYRADDRSLEAGARGSRPPAGGSGVITWTTIDFLGAGLTEFAYRSPSGTYAIEAAVQRTDGSIESIWSNRGVVTVPEGSGIDVESLEAGHYLWDASTFRIVFRVPDHTSSGAVHINFQLTRTDGSMSEMPDTTESKTTWGGELLYLSVKDIFRAENDWDGLEYRFGDSGSWSTATGDDQISEFDDDDDGGAYDEWWNFASRQWETTRQAGGYWVDSTWATSGPPYWANRVFWWEPGATTMRNRPGRTTDPAGTELTLNAFVIGEIPNNDSHSNYTWCGYFTVVFTVSSISNQGYLASRVDSNPIPDGLLPDSNFAAEIDYETTGTTRWSVRIGIEGFKGPTPQDAATGVVFWGTQHYQGTTGDGTIRESDLQGIQYYELDNNDPADLGYWTPFGSPIDSRKSGAAVAFRRLPQLAAQVPEPTPHALTRYDPDTYILSIERPNALRATDDWTATIHEGANDTYGFTASAGTVGWDDGDGVDTATMSFKWVKPGSLIIKAGERVDGHQTTWQGYPSLSIPTVATDADWSVVRNEYLLSEIVWSSAYYLDSETGNIWYPYYHSVTTAFGRQTYVLENPEGYGSMEWRLRGYDTDHNGDSTAFNVTSASWPTEVTFVLRSLSGSWTPVALMPASYPTTLTYNDRTAVRFLLPGIRDPGFTGDRLRLSRAAP